VRRNFAISEKNKIIEQYWLNDEVNQAFSKMHPEELQYDLKVEVFMVLLEMEDKLNEPKI
jgi:hypothetical protein